jgi:hypothetical protein
MNVLIVHNKALGVYEWPDTGDTICIIPPGKSPREAMTAYLTSEKGTSSLTFIDGLIKKAEEDAEKKEPKKQPKKEAKEKVEA